MLLLPAKSLLIYFTFQYDDILTHPTPLWIGTWISISSFQQRLLLPIRYSDRNYAVSSTIPTKRYRAVWRCYLRPGRQQNQQCKHVDGSRDVTTALHSDGGRWASLDLLSCWAIGLQSELGLYSMLYSALFLERRLEVCGLWAVALCVSIPRDTMFSLLSFPGWSPSVAVHAAISWYRPWLGQAPPTLSEWEPNLLVCYQQSQCKDILSPFLLDHPDGAEAKKTSCQVTYRKSHRCYAEHTVIV